MRESVSCAKKYNGLFVKVTSILNNAKSDFTHGSIFMELTAFTMSILGTLFIHTTYGAVDVLVVSL